jgi:hydroxymethylpyrimidine/phosphomethylpyrimidine kinase
MKFILLILGEQTDGTDGRTKLDTQFTAYAVHNITVLTCIPVQSLSRIDSTHHYPDTRRQILCMAQQQTPEVHWHHLYGLKTTLYP